MLPFPPELVEAVIERLPSPDYGTFNACSLLSSNFRNTGQRMIFRTVNMDCWSIDRVAQLVEAVSDDNCNRLSSYIQDVSMIFPKAITTGSAGAKQEYENLLADLLLPLENLQHLAIIWPPQQPRTWWNLPGKLKGAMARRCSGLYNTGYLRSLSVVGIWGLPLQLVIHNPFLSRLHLHQSAFDGMGLVQHRSDIEGDTQTGGTTEDTVHLALQEFVDDTNMNASSDLLSVSRSIFAGLTSFKVSKVITSHSLVRNLEACLASCSNTLQELDISVKITTHFLPVDCVKLPEELPVLRSLTFRAESDSPLKAIAFLRTSLEQPTSFPMLEDIRFYAQIAWPYPIDGYPVSTIRELGWRLLDFTLSQESKFPRLSRVHLQERALDKAPESTRVDVEAIVERVKELSTVQHDLPGISSRAREEGMRRTVEWNPETPGIVIERNVQWTS